ncbi:MAG: class I SAM-dependent methyltransferase [Acidimicrobiia bacterium]
MDDPVIRYFEEQLPTYSTARLGPAAAWIADHLGPQVSLVDVGCGSGNTLEYLRSRTGIRDVVGVDPSPAMLRLTAERLGCSTHRASVLQADLQERLGRSFDVAVMSAVLHHLVGRTRRASRWLAGRAMGNALRLVRPGGYLVVVEPVFYPAAAMTAVFYLKQAVATVFPHRVGILGRWNNIGAPVVSYLTIEELSAMAESSGGRVVALESLECRLHWLVRLCGVRRRYDTTLVVQRQT